MYLYIFSFRKISEEFGTVKNICSHTNINKTIKYNIKYKNNIFIYKIYVLTLIVVWWDLS